MKQMIDGKTVYPIDIYYSGIGIINAPSAEGYEEMFQERFFRIVEQMKQKQEMTEQLKAINPIKWTQLMNCIRQQANEIIFAELIFN